MKSVSPVSGLSRRHFLRGIGASALGITLSGCGFLATEQSGSHSSVTSGKPLRGIFPIAQTPFTPDNKLDLLAMIEQVRFTDRGRVHGFVWPQNASEWMTLSEQERMEGMSAIAATGKSLKPAIVLGVQGSDLSVVKRYVMQAKRVGADAIISLPPSETADHRAVVDYYQQVGRMSDLPLFVQAVGDMDDDMLLEMYRTIPTMRYIKHEAGDPLQHVATLRQKSSNEIKVFSGGHGRKLIEEMTAGFSGSMPAASLADLYARTFDMWQAGQQDEARAMQERTLKALAQMLQFGQEGMKYVLCQRGVFKTYQARPAQTRGFTAAATMASGGSNTRPIDAKGKQELDEMVQSLKPYFTA